ncbi:unnamed protein product [Mycena citricolor]|uniref:Uncharacterized protein n=1 Tax=Mycena citricolor TaxID=2018698 RepID=A0AAD2K785_9AGAR|nr:unnamed protein product [Mycena citricolor]
MRKTWERISGGRTAAGMDALCSALAVALDDDGGRRGCSCEGVQEASFFIVAGRQPLLCTATRAHAAPRQSPPKLSAQPNRHCRSGRHSNRSAANIREDLVALRRRKTQSHVTPNTRQRTSFPRLPRDPSGGCRLGLVQVSASTVCSTLCSRILTLGGILYGLSRNVEAGAISPLLGRAKGSCSWR